MAVNPSANGKQMITYRHHLVIERATAWSRAWTEATARATARARATANTWAGAWARTNTTARAVARTPTEARARASTRTWITAWTQARTGINGYCGFFDNLELDAIWEQAIQGDNVALMAFYDKLQEIEDPQMYDLQINQIVFIETPTFYYHGIIDEIAMTYLKLKPNAHEIRFLNNLHVFFQDNKYQDNDEVTAMPGSFRIPALSIIGVQDWVYDEMAKLNKTDKQMRGISNKTGFNIEAASL